MSRCLAGPDGLGMAVMLLLGAGGMMDRVTSGWIENSALTQRRLFLLVALFFYASSPYPHLRLSYERARLRSGGAAIC